MRAFFIFRKCLRQQLRDRLGLALSMLTAPFFILLYWFFFSIQPIVFTIVAFNKDIPILSESKKVNYGHEIIQSMEKLTLMNEGQHFQVLIANDLSEFNLALLHGGATAGLIIPSTFSYAVENESVIPQAVLLTGNINLPSYHIVKSNIMKIMQKYNNQKYHMPPLIRLEEKPIGLAALRTPFDAYVPGVLVFAVIMLIFSSSMAVAREIDARTLDRLKIASVHPLAFCFGISTVQIIQGLISVFLTFVTARILGFHSTGSIIFAFIISGVACFASVGIGIAVASISRNQTRALLISSVAMFMLILFSGIIFPRPEVNLFQFGNYSIKLFDFLPTTHMKTGLEKILTMGVSPFHVAYEIGSLSLLSIFYFGIGVLMFKRFDVTYA
jgi:ABC-type polysaccharide/polyol phosphate export permease